MKTRRKRISYYQIKRELLRPKQEKMSLSKELFDNPKEDSIHFMELKGTSCRWPVSKDNLMYCGHHTEETYCEFHSAVAYK